MRVAIVLLLATVALAGCAKEAAQEECPNNGCGPIIPPGELDEDKGAIRGVIIDPSITPIEGVRVTLAGSDAETVTDAGGAFLFLNLEPATYFLSASKVGYGAVQQSVEVKVGLAQPPIVKVLMERMPGTEPFTSYLDHAGYVGCAVQVANFVQGNLCSAAGDPDGNEIFDFGAQPTIPTTVQTELLWEYTQAIGERLGTIQYAIVDDEAKRHGNVWGTSPLICRVTQAAVCDNGDGTGGGGDGLNETGFTGQVRVNVYANCFQTCVPGTAVGLGLVLQQEFHLYGIAFYNHGPPEDWMFVRDGRFDPPE